MRRIANARHKLGLTLGSLGVGRVGYTSPRGSQGTKAQVTAMDGATCGSRPLSSLREQQPAVSLRSNSRRAGFQCSTAT